MNFGFFNEIPNYFGQTIDLVNTVPFDFQQLPKYTPIIPPPNIINETLKVQKFDTGNFQDFEFRAPLQSVLIPPTVAPPIIESVIPTPPIVEQVIPPIVQSAQPVPPAWQPFYVPQIIQQIPQPSAPTVIQIIQQPVQPTGPFVGPVRERGNNALSGLFTILPVVSVLLLAMK